MITIQFMYFCVLYTNLKKRFHIHRFHIGQIEYLRSLGDLQQKTVGLLMLHGQ